MSEIDLKRFFLEQVRLFETFTADKVEEIVIKSRLATFEATRPFSKPATKASFSAC
jgi:acetate kinase